MAGGNEDSSIKAILLAANHFDMLKLPRPYPDLMEAPMWDVPPDTINRAFRKLSLCCHPDKSTHPDAPRAFEAIKKAKQCLLSEHERDDYVRDFVRRLKTTWEGNWTSAGGAADSKQRVNNMRDAALRQQSDSVSGAMRERRERAEQLYKRKQRLQQAAQARSYARQQATATQPEEEEDDNDDRAFKNNVGSGEAQSSVAGLSRHGGSSAATRKRPKFL